MSLAYCSAQNSSQGPQPLLTRSWVSVKASHILLIMRAVYQGETPPCSWSFRSLQGRVIGWRAHNSTPLPVSQRYLWRLRCEPSLWVTLAIRGPRIWTLRGK